MSRIIKSGYIQNKDILVAGHDAPRRFKNIADFICDGEDDQVEVWAAARKANGKPVYLSGTICMTSPRSSLPPGLVLIGIA